MRNHNLESNEPITIINIASHATIGPPPRKSANSSKAKQSEPLSTSSRNCSACNRKRPKAKGKRYRKKSAGLKRRSTSRRDSVPKDTNTESRLQEHNIVRQSTGKKIELENDVADFDYNDAQHKKFHDQFWNRESLEQLRRQYTKLNPLGCEHGITEEAPREEDSEEHRGSMSYHVSKSQIGRDLRKTISKNDNTVSEREGLHSVVAKDEPALQDSGLRDWENDRRSVQLPVKRMDIIKASCAQRQVNKVSIEANKSIDDCESLLPAQRNRGPRLEYYRTLNISQGAEGDHQDYGERYSFKKTKSMVCGRLSSLASLLKNSQALSSQSEKSNGLEHRSSKMRSNKSVS